jgi:predicted dehydrogenase
MGEPRREKLRGVAVGAGYFSQFHLDAWQRIEEAEIVALCDLDAERAEQKCREYAIPRSYVDVDQMLDAEQPDFIDIITRPDTHLALCSKAAARSVAIICQKPLAPTFQQAQEIVERTTPVAFMVHENFRFQPWHREAKRLIEAGAIGNQLQTITLECRTGDGWQQDAYLDRQPYFRTMPRLLIYETGVHFIDTFRYLFGEVSSVYASLRRLNSNIQGEDTGIVVLGFDSGAQGLIAATRYHEADTDDPRYTFGKFTIDGNGGTIRIELDGSMTIHPLGGTAERHEYEHGQRGFASDCVLQTQRHFVRQLLSDCRFETDGANYLRTLAVQEAVYQSAQQAKMVAVSE